MGMTNKDDLKKLLKEKVLTVKFKKKDDSIRKMVCTLSSEYLPDNESKEIEKKTKAENPNVLPVWDLEKLAWRSFRVDSVVEYETNW
jgi:hypothetical protein